MWNLNESQPNPNKSPENAITCKSDLVESIKKYFAETWRSLNKEDVISIINDLRDDIQSCEINAQNKFTELQADVFKRWINVQKWWVWEERLLPRFWVDRNELYSNVEELWMEFPEKYTFRLSGKWIVFSDMQGKAFINYDTEQKIFEEPWYFTKNDDMSDNSDGFMHTLAKQLYTKNSINWLYKQVQSVLKEWSIEIKNLDDVKAQEHIAQLYGLNTDDFKKALAYFLTRFWTDPTEKNIHIRLFDNWSFQISHRNKEDEWKMQIVNFNAEGIIQSEYDFQ